MEVDKMRDSRGLEFRVGDTIAFPLRERCIQHGGVTIEFDRKMEFGLLSGTVLSLERLDDGFAECGGTIRATIQDERWGTVCVLGDAELGWDTTVLLLPPVDSIQLPTEEVQSVDPLTS